MDKNMLGGLICYERERKEINIQMLVRDICSPVAIQRLETGDRMPDYFVLERILERLGKSLNKIEFLYDEKVYEIFYLRGMLEYYLEEKDYAEVLDALAYPYTRNTRNLGQKKPWHYGKAFVSRNDICIRRYLHRNVNVVRCRRRSWQMHWK